MTQPNAQSVVPRSVTVYRTMALMAGQPGAPLPRYATALDRPRIWRWVPEDTSALASPKVLGHTGGYVGRWLEVRLDDRGPDLLDADATLTVDQGEWRVLPAATPLTAARTITLATTSALLGDPFELTRLGLGAFPLAVLNGGAAAGTLWTFPASQRWSGRATFDGANWIARQAGQMP